MTDLTLLTPQEWGTYWTMGLCSGSLALATLVTAAAFRRLVPLERRIASQQTQL